VCVASEAEEGFFERARGGLALEGSGVSSAMRRPCWRTATRLARSSISAREWEAKSREVLPGCMTCDFRKWRKDAAGDSVEAAVGLVEKKDARGVKEGASEGEALNSAGRKSADLAIERFGEFELRGELRDAIARKRQRRDD